MLLSDLELALSRIPPHPTPKAALEQYATPADIAALLLFEATNLGDITDKTVADLGCGTGIFAIGAAILRAREVIGLDTDEDAIAIARKSAHAADLTIDWRTADIRTYDTPVDTVLMNPPFGAQNRGADRPFLDAAFTHANTIYTLHNAITRPFIETNAQRAGFNITHRWRLLLPLQHQYAHQTKRTQTIEVIAYRFERQNSATPNLVKGDATKP